MNFGLSQRVCKKVFVSVLKTQGNFFHPFFPPLRTLILCVLIIQFFCTNISFFLCRNSGQIESVFVRFIKYVVRTPALSFTYFHIFLIRDFSHKTLSFSSY